MQGNVADLDLDLPLGEVGVEEDIDPSQLGDRFEHHFGILCQHQVEGLVRERHEYGRRHHASNPSRPLNAIRLEGTVQRSCRPTLVVHPGMVSFPDQGHRASAFLHRHAGSWVDSDRPFELPKRLLVQAHLAELEGLVDMRLASNKAHATLRKVVAVVRRSLLARSSV